MSKTSTSLALRLFEPPLGAPPQGSSKEALCCTPRKHAKVPIPVLKPFSGPAERPTMAMRSGYGILTKPEPNHQPRLATSPLTS
jgi:hypothetical protein